MTVMEVKIRQLMDINEHAIETLRALVMVVNTEMMQVEASQ